MSGSITGTIRDTEGKALTNATVTISDLCTSGETVSGESNFYFDLDLAKYSFSSLPIGKHAVSVTVPGFATQTLTAEIKNEETVVCNFILVGL